MARPSQLAEESHMAARFRSSLSRVLPVVAIALGVWASVLMSSGCKGPDGDASSTGTIASESSSGSGIESRSDAASTSTDARTTGTRALADNSSGIDLLPNEQGSESLARNDAAGDIDENADLDESSSTDPSAGPNGSAGVAVPPRAASATDELLRKLQPAIDASKAAEKDGGKTAAETAGTRVTTAASGPPPALRHFVDGARPSPNGESVKETSPAETAAFPDAERADLLDAAKAFAKEIVGDLAAGDRDRLRAAFVSREELSQLLTPGGYDLLSAYVGPASDARMTDAAQIAKNAVKSHSWEPGTLARTPRHQKIWSVNAPMLVGSTLTLELVDGPLLLHLDQMVYTKGHWRIFRMVR
jgi:hypothetical protein